MKLSDRIRPQSEAAPWVVEEVKQLEQQRDELAEALKDMLGGWRYIRETHGDLYGVGWDRAEDAARAALAKL